MSNNHGKLVFKIQRNGILIDTLIQKRDEIEENFKKNNINNLASARSTSILIIDDEAYLIYI
jgi:hypothetical protein